MTINLFFPIIDRDTISIINYIRTIRSRDVLLWFRKEDTQHELIRLLKDKKIINENLSIDHEVQYIKWDLMTYQFYDASLYDALITRTEKNGTEFIVVLSSKCLKSQLFLFYDAPHRKDLPSIFFRVKVISSKDDFFNLLSSLSEFNIEDETKYKRLDRHIKGATIYKELSSGRFLYLDTFHKTHYEVYDSTGMTHLGEMDLFGVFDGSKRDKSKPAITDVLS